jgi:hypothetical protein
MITITLQFPGAVRGKFHPGARQDDVGHHLEAPDDLRGRQRREFLQLQFDHRLCLGEVGFRQLHDAQEDLGRREPRDVQLGLEKGVPILGDDFRRKRLAGELESAAGESPRRRWR